MVSLVLTAPEADASFRVLSLSLESATPGPSYSENKVPHNPPPRNLAEILKLAAKGLAPPSVLWLRVT
jgi:hypothetical protein